MVRQGEDIEELRERLEAVKARIAAAAERSGRSPGGIGLVAVTKLHPSNKIKSLLSLGHQLLGENRVHELLDKKRQLGGIGEWHLVGHLQRNKARPVVGEVSLIHSVDSVRLIEELEKQAARKGIEQSILLELNVAEEPGKTGALPAELSGLLDELAQVPHLKAEGLMTMAPYDPDPERSRPYFAKLRETLSTIAERPNFTPRHLSMGMSGDFEVAIEEGATLVRVGTAILGERPKP